MGIRSWALLKPNTETMFLVALYMNDISYVGWACRQTNVSFFLYIRLSYTTFQLCLIHLSRMTLALMNTCTIWVQELAITPQQRNTTNSSPTNAYTYVYICSFTIIASRCPSDIICILSRRSCLMLECFSCKNKETTKHTMPPKSMIHIQEATFYYTSKNNVIVFHLQLDKRKAFPNQLLCTHDDPIMKITQCFLYSYVKK